MSKALSTPPKMLNIVSTTSRNLRTLIWLKKQNNTVNWSRWFGIVSSLEEYEYWSQHNTKIVGIVLTNLETNEEYDKLHKIAKKVPVVFLSELILIKKNQSYWDENYDNVLNLNALHNQYQFIGNAWDGSLEDAISIFALICRYNRIIDCKVPEKRYEIVSNVMTITHNIQPNKVWLFTQFFQHKDKKRYLEIKQCLKNNCECPDIDTIVLLNEKDFSNEWKNIPNSNKIKQVVINKRLTYSDFLKYVYDNVPNDVFTILSNADIYFDETLIELYKTNMEDKMFGLLRWDVDTNGKAELFGPRNDSQDSWIFLSNSIKSRKWDFSKFNFQLGQAGCDNAFAAHILRQKFAICNPANTLKTYHIHNTNIRNYNTMNYIHSDIYMNVSPTNILDTKQEICPAQKPSIISNELVSFEIKSSSMSNEITYCTMLEKEGRYKWEPSVENHYFQPEIPVYSWKNCGVTNNGLVYDLHTIYKGKYADDIKYKYWAYSNIDIFTPVQKRPKMFAIPFKDTTIFKHPDVYILNYLSRCIRLTKLYPDTSFWIPPQFSKYLNYLNLDIDKLNSARFSERTACWADEVIGLLPGPHCDEFGSEDIMALRELLSSWKETPISKTCVVILDPSLTQSFVDEKITSFLHSKDEDWTIRYVNSGDYASYDSMFGASLCIFVGGSKADKSWTRLWALPKNCCVIEFQQELQINGEFQHLAHMAGFKSWVLLLAKGKQSDVQEQIMEQLTKWFKKNEDELATIQS